MQVIAAIFGNFLMNYLFLLGGNLSVITAAVTSHISGPTTITASDTIKPDQPTAHTTMVFN